MLKIPLLQNKESVIGYGLFISAFILFLVNVLFVFQTLSVVYGYQPIVNTAVSIDGTVISEANALIE